MKIDHQLIYVSYPMSGSTDWGLKRGMWFAEHLREKYPEYTFLAPHEIMLSEDGTSHQHPAFSHGDYIRKDIEHGLKHCDAIALGEGWTRSTGCIAEFQYATMSDMRTYLIQEEDGQREFGLVPLW